MRGFFHFYTCLIDMFPLPILFPECTSYNSYIVGLLKGIISLKSKYTFESVVEWDKKEPNIFLV